MALRWAAVTFVETEKNCRRVMGYQNLQMLKAHLDEDPEEKTMAVDKKVGCLRSYSRSRHPLKVSSYRWDAVDIVLRGDSHLNRL